MAAVLGDLANWACDIASLLSAPCPEDRVAIERVRTYVLAWLAGRSPSDISLEDVVMTTAALMSAIDRRFSGKVRPVIANRSPDSISLEDVVTTTETPTSEVDGRADESVLDENEYTALGAMVSA